MPHLKRINQQQIKNIFSNVLIKLSILAHCYNLLYSITISIDRILPYLRQYSQTKVFEVTLFHQMNIKLWIIFVFIVNSHNVHILTPNLLGIAQKTSHVSLSTPGVCFYLNLKKVSLLFSDVKGKLIWCWVCYCEGRLKKRLENKLL